MPFLFWRSSSAHIGKAFHGLGEFLNGLVGISVLQAVFHAVADTVSYTHLDVYKRQVLSKLAEQTDVPFDREQLDEIYGMIDDASFPVSYTHLEKRKNLNQRSACRNRMRQALLLI